MTTITVKARQTVYDIAIEQYGTCEAAGEILVLNPEIANDPAALTLKGIDSIAEKGFYLDVAVAPGMRLYIDDQSDLMRKGTIKELTTDITTYHYGPND